MEHRIIYTRLYDSEVEYLKSTGTQWIDTGVYGTSDTTIEFTSSFSVNSYDDTMSVGVVSWTDDQGKSLGFIYNASSKLFYMFLGNKCKSSRVTPGLISNTAYHFVVKQDGVWIDSQKIYDGYYSGSISTRYTIPFFARIDQGSGNLKYSTTGTIFYNLKIYDNTTLVRDFIPVRKGSTGYMYDRVSKKLFANQGTGNFILGQDVSNPVPNIRRVFKFDNKRFVMSMPYDSKIEYLESTGTQFIDTGIYGSNNLKIILDIQLSELSVSKAVFGCYANNNNLYIYQSGGNNIGKWQFGFGYNANCGLTDTNRHLIVMENFSLKIDGTLIFTHTTMTFTTPRTLLMFNMYNASGETYNASDMKIFSCKIYNGNTLVRDFIPVRLGQVGYMYDKVSGKLFGNAGTGQFILGNDIND